MATIDQTSPALDVQDTLSVLNNLLARAYTVIWETIFYVTVFAVAVLTRFIGLDDRVMNH